MNAYFVFSHIKERKPTTPPYPPTTHMPWCHSRNKHCHYEFSFIPQKEGLYVPSD